MRNIRIINLGELITPNMLAGVAELAKKSGLSMQRIDEITKEELVFAQIMTEQTSCPVAIHHLLPV